MAIMSNLANHLLIAMPACKDPHFEKVVVYVCEHHEMGSVGLIINKPMEYKLELVFSQLQIEPLYAEQKKQPLLFGGPSQPERGFVIHKQVGQWRSSLILQDDVIITTSNDIIRAIANNEGPKDALVALGYSGWVSQQLETEILNNVWLVCPYNKEILYEVPFEQRWTYAGFSLGIDMNQLTSEVGHA
jgi:putative transcriptional regulator